MKIRRLAAAAVAILSLLCSGTASALTCTASAGSTNFGSYDPLSAAPVNSVGTISVTCSDIITLLVSYTLQLSTGIAGAYPTREMANGPSRLAYNLYTDPARTTVWGDGSGGSATVADGYLLILLIPVTRNYFVYGRIPAGQNVAVGTYSDTIVVTVTY
jgi:spore coat protein U-like protein